MNKKKTGTLEKYYSLNEAIELLDISKEYLYRLLRAGKIKGAKIGNRWRIPESELRKVLKEDEN